MNIQKKKLLFLIFFYLNNQASSNINNFAAIEASLENISPTTSFLKAAIIACIAYLTNEYIENKIKEKDEEKLQNQDVGNTKNIDSKLSHLEKTILKKITSKLNTNMTGPWIDGIYTNIFLPSGASNITDNPYLSNSIKNISSESYPNLSIIANELNTFGNFFQLFGEFSKFKKSLTRITKRFADITIQSLITSFSIALAYKYTMDTLKKSVESKLNQVPSMNDKPYLKDGISVITAITCDLLILAPLFEHYIIPTGHLLINHFTKTTSNIVKWKNINFLAQATQQNFYEYEESEEILDTRDIHTCLKYTGTIIKCIKNCKFLPFYKYISFLF